MASNVMQSRRQQAQEQS
jgi:protein SCO1